VKTKDQSLYQTGKDDNENGTSEGGDGDGEED
jgi:hypothetical protein